MEKNRSINDIPADTELFGPNAYIRHKPICPNGGGYRVGAVGQKTLCTIPGHTL